MTWSDCPLAKSAKQGLESIKTERCERQTHASHADQILETMSKWDLRKGNLQEYRYWFAAGRYITRGRNWLQPLASGQMVEGKCPWTRSRNKETAWIRWLRVHHKVPLRQRICHIIHSMVHSVLIFTALQPLSRLQFRARISARHPSLFFCGVSQRWLPQQVATLSPRSSSRYCSVSPAVYQVSLHTSSFRCYSEYRPMINMPKLRWKETPQHKGRRGLLRNRAWFSSPQLLSPTAWRTKMRVCRCPNEMTETIMSDRLVPRHAEPVF